MESKLTVLVPAASHDLITLDVLKDEYGITVDTDDVRLQRWIHDASLQVETELDRVVVLETVSEVFRQPASPWTDDRREAPLLLRRYPVTTVASVTIDGGAEIDPALYEFDAEAGKLWSLTAGGGRAHWSFGTRMEVVYSGGYTLGGTMPPNLEQACLRLVQTRQSARERDPSLRRSQTAGVGEDEWFAVSAERSLPSDILDLIDPFRRVLV